MKTQPDDSLLKETAVTVGSAVGKVAAIAKSAFSHGHKATAAAPAPAAKAGKLPPKHKKRLPRREKKTLAHQKAM